MQKIKLKTEESGKKLLEAYAPPKWSETADDDDDLSIYLSIYIELDVEKPPGFMLQLGIFIITVGTYSVR